MNTGYVRAANTLESAPGTYALILGNARPARLAVGRLGSIHLRSGVYVYVGSALGPGGLQARVGRHLDHTRAAHWNIDYLKRAADIVEVWYVLDSVRREHVWAEALGGLAGASIPMPGFGASDCRCTAHLFYFPSAPRLTAFARALRQVDVAGGGGGQSLRRLPIVNAG
ncbi:MAG TPA: GIY-YIG nuclease family protein [Burkholderiales bacterium]|jgi:Uri superfamily endonuclease|nr:GIY-YIG nuclease family protein [Burkholderiales bacterium]